MKRSIIAALALGFVGAGCTVEDDDPDTIVNPPANVEVNPPSPPANIEVNPPSPPPKIEDKSGETSTSTTG